MKRLFWITSALLLIASGCKKMDFNYKQFIGDGEIKYVSKADSLHVRGGDERAELSWLLMSDPSVSSYKIYWDNKQDSVMGKVVKTDDIDTIRVIVDNISEGSHEFQVYLLNDNGNTSVMASTMGKVYGTLYKRTLLNRLIAHTQFFKGDQLEIEMGLPEETFLYSEIKYLNTDDEWISRIIMPEVEIDTLSDFPNGGEFEMRSAFKPDSLALDTFYTEFETYETEEVVIIEDPFQLSFSTRVAYGNQADQFSVLVSTDFDGVYELANVESADWTDITDEFMLSTGQADFIDSEVINLSPHIDPDKPIYVAFRYTYLPDSGTPRNWLLENILVETEDSKRKVGIEPNELNLVYRGDTDRDVAVVTPTRITFRGNTELRDKTLITWGISEPLE